jgi:hypothetical protein
VTTRLGRGPRPPPPPGGTPMLTAAAVLLALFALAETVTHHALDR